MSGDEICTGCDEARTQHEPVLLEAGGEWWHPPCLVIAYEELLQECAAMQKVIDEGA